MKDKLLMILFVLILGSILTTALIAVNYYTTPIIKKNEEITIKSSVLQALEIVFTAENLDESFSANIQIEQKGGKTFYVSTAKDVAFAFSGAGVWGPIEGIIAIKPDYETFKGITIIRQEETPGLGSRITEKAYLDQFSDRKFFPLLTVIQGRPSQQPNEIDAITGATMTSNAFIDIINEQVADHLSVFIGKQ